MSRIDDRQTGKAREIGDFDAYVYGNAPDRAERMLELSEGGFDVVFEAVGSGDSLGGLSGRREARRRGGHDRQFRRAHGAFRAEPGSAA